MAVDQVVWLLVPLLAAGLGIIPAARHPWARFLVYGISLVACLGLLVAGAQALLSAPVTPSEIVLPLGLPGLGSHLRLDPLAGLFLVVVNLGGFGASLFALGYGRHESAPQRVLPFFPLFLAALNLVVLAADAFTFLFAWELMSLASWALVMAHHQDPANARAGLVYLIMAVLSTLCLVGAFGLLSDGGSRLTFELMRQHPPAGWLATAVVVATLLGAGSKAGLVPLHVWLPLAHPAAPSQVSALMSGVMTKVALYALIRIVFDLLGPPAWGWGAAILVLGGITAVVGVLYALMEHDLKRLLAYHTVENIGIIAIGLGLSLAFQANGQGLGAALALTAALFHIVNHSLFKSLLFFGAGAVLGATGERDMEHLGGLIHRMPLTAFFFLVGAAAISALPPLNGFVSEWLTLQAILISPDLPQWLLKFLVPSVGAALALSAALAAACFVKAFGITFLGRPRTAVAREAREAERSSLAAMGLLALCCLLAGVLPGLVVDALGAVVEPLVGARLLPQAQQPWLSLVASTPERSSYNGLIVLSFIAITSIAVWVALHRWGNPATRRAIPWDCGYPEDSPTTQYGAGSFAQPIRRVYGTGLFGAHESVDLPRPGELRAARFAVHLEDPAWRWLVNPVVAAVDALAAQVRKLRLLSIRNYLTLVFATLILLLTVLALWQ